MKNFALIFIVLFMISCGNTNRNYISDEVANKSDKHLTTMVNRLMNVLANKSEKGFEKMLWNEKEFTVTLDKDITMGVEEARYREKRIKRHAEKIDYAIDKFNEAINSDIYKSINWKNTKVTDIGGKYYENEYGKYYKGIFITLTTGNQVNTIYLGDVILQNGKLRIYEFNGLR